MTAVSQSEVRLGGRMRRCGFTIIEVVVALFVLVIFMAGIYGVMSSVMKMRQTARDHYVAALLANNRVERAKTFKYADLALMAEDKTPLDDYGTPDPKGNFRRSTKVMPNYANRLTQVEVSVEVRDHSTGRFRGAAETVSTLLTEYVDPLAQ